MFLGPSFFIVMSLEWPETLGCLYPSKAHKNTYLCRPCETFLPLFIQACARPTYLNFHKICTEPPFWQIYWGHFLGSILLHHWCCAVHNVHPPTLTAGCIGALHKVYFRAGATFVLCANSCCSVWQPSLLRCKPLQCSAGRCNVQRSKCAKIHPKSKMFAEPGFLVLKNCEKK